MASVAGQMIVIADVAALGRSMGTRTTELEER
jgi:hypothetical protein